MARPLHTMWQKPWGFGESLTITIGVFVVGQLLQLAVGPFNFYLLSSPANGYAGAILTAVCIMLGIGARRSHLARWLSGVPFSVMLLIAVLLLSLVMGGVPQSKSSSTLSGFDAVTTHWAFVLFYLLLLLALGTLLVRRLLQFRLHHCVFYLNHLGLWLFLFSSALGYASMERYVMHVGEGETEWRVYDEQKQMKELPIAIQLNDFDMEVYPPQLTVIDRQTGYPLPESRPDYFQIDPDAPCGELNGWSVEVKEYIHRAVGSLDSTYREVPMVEATPAARVSVRSGLKTIEGWVCAGNRAQRSMALPMDESSCLVMTPSQPRSFTSEIVAYAEDGEVRKALVAVNRPLRIGAWTIYQYGYDNDAGRMSSYSSFELVYDPWIAGVYFGIGMMMAGAVGLLLSGRSRKEENR